MRWMDSSDFFEERSKLDFNITKIYEQMARPQKSPHLNLTPPSFLDILFRNRPKRDNFDNSVPDMSFR